MDSKMTLSEEDIKNRYISPAIFETAKWNKSDSLMEYSYTDGRINVVNNVVKRGKQKRVDYLLHYKPNYPLAVVEAKDRKNHPSPSAGLQQGIDYAKDLKVPFAYASNGDAFAEHDMITGTERTLELDEFPTKEELWQRYQRELSLSPEQIKAIEVPFYSSRDTYAPRYYQRIAINRTVEKIANGQRRVMLVMATGTGKTYTAFQIVYRLLKAGIKHRVLYLADRNILVDQAMSDDFGPLSGKITKVQGGKLDSSYPIQFALYQQLVGKEEDAGHEPFRQFKPNFFDLVVIDEAHRGSARADSQWHKILEYFDGPNVTHFGMTATPKREKGASNIDYFGEPIYTYSLKQGIEDGFLAPYKVVRVNLDVDVNGFHPLKGETDKHGRIFDKKLYTSSDFDRSLIIEQRTERVAKYVSDYMKDNNSRWDKSIIFCEDVEHAERMRQAFVNENSDLVAQDSRYVMQITGDDKEGKAQLSNFEDVTSKFPTIVTTSKLLTTGVNVKTCKIIVLDSNINSMTEFKQIIGRGTRLDPEHGKEYFTIIDFRGVSRLFADPAFDGEPIEIADGNNSSGHDRKNSGSEVNEGLHTKYEVSHSVKVLGDQTQYLDDHGDLITTSLTDYTKKNILGKYATLDKFLQDWNSATKKQELLDSLEEHGILYQEIMKQENIKDLDPFDLIVHLAYNQKPLTKAERINNVKKSGLLDKYQGAAREILNKLIDKYKNNGIADLESNQVLSLPEFDQYGGAVKIMLTFGGKKNYENIIKQIKEKIYS
ncbi:EcoAI/FtnUII family type I restriction enzme subunit R [Lactobacillus sp. W8093]|uniref:EcoAI/FtnUII family type I restriction enzme subunit R n=1 Tax=Lactobacillus sp. W8093 TaxID=2751038 RepID=UPI0018EF74F8|nr:DEAD/DEAH box helicase family protein [Lactobacillus sp. W8093]MBI0109944.1 DEAD/DEAH box helicase family protein [Lactobacillus sp. W8093]MCT6889560.1 DEAD/DEAH box helicase family protein [Lactobacillus sp.]